MEKNSHAKNGARLRMGILYEITALLLVVMLASGLATFFLLRRSQEQLIDKSVNKLVETEAENFASSFNYVIQMLVEKYAVSFSEQARVETILAFQEKRISDFQMQVSEEARGVVDSGFLGISTLMLVLPPSQFMPEATVFAASDPGRVFNWEVPGYIVEAIGDGSTYLLMEDGVPELGLEDEQLLIFASAGQSLEIAGTSRSLDFSYITIKPMHDEIASIESFFASEKNNSTTILAGILGLTLVLVVLIIFLVLSYLIRKRITQPIEELSAAAGELSQGNLDVEINVHEGGEFETLERTFRSMIESFRRYIAASVGDGEDGDK